MKKLFLALLFLGCCFLMSAQSEPIVGDEFIIKAPTNQTYNYIKFPRPNILIKRGVVNHYKSVYGNSVVIHEVKTKNDGTYDVILKKKDGSNFFGYVSKVKANFNKAIEAKEMVAAR